MIETGYAVAIFTALVFTGVVLVFKDLLSLMRGKTGTYHYHFLMWCALALNLLTLGAGQVLLKNYSVPYLSGLVGILTGYGAVYVSTKARKYWPLWIVGCMATTVMSDGIYIFVTLAAEEPSGHSKFFYQSLGNIMVYVSLFALIVHKKVRPNERKYSYSYS